MGIELVGQTKPMKTLLTIVVDDAGNTAVVTELQKRDAERLMVGTLSALIHADDPKPNAVQAYAGLPPILNGRR